MKEEQQTICIIFKICKHFKYYNLSIKKTPITGVFYFIYFFIYYYITYSYFPS